LTVPKDRYQFSFPVLATTQVVGFNERAQDSGRNIQAVFEEIIAQTYPFKYCDIDGTWHLVKFRTPYPLAAITSSRKPDGNANAEQDKTYQVLLVQVDELDSTGAYNAWEAG
jgi:hypothetical protein